jgi:hypothetical protein
MGRLNLPIAPESTPGYDEHLYSRALKL